MNIFAFVSLLVTFSCFTLAIFVFKAAKNNNHRIWAFFNLSVSLWSINLFFVAISHSSYNAESFWRLAYGFGVFVVIVFYHFIYSFCGLRRPNILIGGYIIGIIFVPLVIFYPGFINGLNYVFGSFYYSRATTLFNFFVFYVGFFVWLSFRALLKYIKSAEGDKRIQAQYILWGFGLGWAGGISTFLPHYNISLYPVWHFSICIYTFIVTYALLKHNLLGINITARKALLPVSLFLLIFGGYISFNYHLTLFALAGLSLGILCLLLAFFVLAYSNEKVHRIWALFNTAVALWGLGTCFAGMATTSESAVFRWRLAYLPCTFIAIAFYHLVCSFCHLKRNTIFRFAYIQGFIFLPFIIFSDFFVDSTSYVFNDIYYHKATLLFSFWVIIFCSITASAFLELVRFITKTKGIEKIRALYLVWGMALGWAGGLTTLLPPFNIKPVYPAWHFTICIYTILMTYAIFKYRVMDIKVAVTRTGVFIAVYSLLLGIPFVVTMQYKPWFMDLFGSEWWIVPLVLMGGLATIAPFIYIYLEHKAEARLFREQKRYQSILRQASLGMTRIRNLQKLLNLITHIVTKTVKITYAAIYIYDKNSDEYVLQVSRYRGRESILKLTSDNPLIAWLASNRRVLIYEEAKLRAQDTKDIIYKQLEEHMRLLCASVIIPSMLEHKFMGLIVLGEKISGQIYSTEDLNVFEVLASQAALAIENAQFYEDSKEMQEQISQAEKMATIGTMADGLSHQINNRFYALSLIASDSIESIKMLDTTKCSPAVKEAIEGVSHALERIQSNVLQGGEVVRGMLKYSRRGEEGFEPIDLDKILDGTLEMVQFKVKLSELDIIRNFNHAPKINGNMAQLEEVFFNFIDNAYEAIVERRQTFQEENYRGRITISAEVKTADTIRIVVEDNGIGVKNEDTKKIFTPFFTTKVSSRKGTGLGLYVIKRIITEVHKGKVSLESQYKAGTRFIVELPLAK